MASSKEIHDRMKSNFRHQEESQMQCICLLIQIAKSKKKYGAGV